MIKKFILLLVIVCGLFRISGAQEINKAGMDALFDTLVKYNKTMGAIAVARHGKIEYQRAMGTARVTAGERVQATTQTLYRVASVTKMFTATMIFQLIEEGKISLNGTLGEYFPGLPNGKTITISNLLNHRSGLQNYIFDTSWKMGPQTEYEILDRISRSKPLFEPGSSSDYSNTNYVLLGYIIERVTGQSYADALNDRILKKAGLHNTFYGDVADSGRQSISYTFMNGHWYPAHHTDVSILAGAGAIVSTPADLLRFIDALFSGKLVSSKSLGFMKNVTDGRGMGMISIPFYEHQGYGHTGAIDGYTAVICYYPDVDLALAYCSNGTTMPVNDIVVGALSMCFNRSYTPPSYLPVAVSAADLDPLLGSYREPEIDMVMKITRDNATLIAQATGQEAFSLKALGGGRFLSDNTGIELEFHPAYKAMILKQNGRKFVFKKL